MILTGIEDVGETPDGGVTLKADGEFHKIQRTELVTTAEDGEMEVPGDEALDDG